MAPVKLPKNELATEHLLITKKQKRVIFAIAKLEGERVSEIVRRMINEYVTDKYGDEIGHEKFNRFFITKIK